MEITAKLSIGYPGATHEEIIEIDDTELSKCISETEREKVINQYVTDWANNYIEYWYE